MKAPEAPLYQDKKKRSTLVRSIGSAVVEAAAPDPELFAIWKVAIQSDLRAGKSYRNHLKRIGSLQILLVTNQLDESSYNPAHWRAIEQHFEPELGVARGFKAGLNDMPEMWRAALQDMLKLRADKEGVDYS